MIWKYKLPDEESVHTLDSSVIPSYGITLDPTSVEALRAICLHIHGRFPQVSWEDEPLVPEEFVLADDVPVFPGAGNNWGGKGKPFSLTDEEEMQRMEAEGDRAQSIREGYANSPERG